ncbi:MAG TPA: ABC transporter substrate-binding protein [Solirubrobacteraceae bacterium]|nr:ABC transporter substrate-binding protein [Solirubrobacteraceae bacterium]
MASARHKVRERTPARRPAVAALTVLAVAFGGCGKISATVTQPPVKPFVVALAGAAGPDEAPLLVAGEEGYFTAAGLDVQLRDHVAAPLKRLREGQVQMAIASEPELLMARDHGAQVVAVAALFQRPLGALITIRQRGREALAGRPVGTDGSPLAAAELQTIAADAHAVDVGDELVGAITDGRLHATLGATWNYQALEPALLRRHPVVLPVDRVGVPTYAGLVLIVTVHSAHTDGEDLRAMLQALARGERTAQSDPAGATRAVLKATPTSPPALVRASLGVTDAAQSTTGGQWGAMNDDQWASFGRWMVTHGLLSAPLQPADWPFTNEYLPGEGI